MIFPVSSNKNPLELPDLLCSKELCASICSSSAAASRTGPSSSVGSSARSVAQRCCSCGAGMAAAVLEARMPKERGLGWGLEGLEGLKWWDLKESHRIHGAAIYGNMDPINIPPMLVYTWILWECELGIFRNEYVWRTIRIMIEYDVVTEKNTNEIDETNCQISAWIWFDSCDCNLQCLQPHVKGGLSRHSYAQIYPRHDRQIRPQFLAPESPLCVPGPKRPTERREDLRPSRSIMWNQNRGSLLCILTCYVMLPGTSRIFGQL